MKTKQREKRATTAAAEEAFPVQKIKIDELLSG